ncbi:MAG: site-2 protease family protein [Candidatus Marinimicrobia bacterium]|nr:site-2 protease family protein [Candidatus Neomarinimicrobiota bacterium]
MLFRLPVDVLLLLIPTLLFALVFHEFSHAYMAYRLGDRTAAFQGRLTLNPLAHLDPFGSLMILFVGFGWAKPVPVDVRNLHNPRTDMMLVAFAGPAANLVLGLIGGILLRFFGDAGFLNNTMGLMLYFFVRINITLAVFNMIPLPPLDGSQIFSGLMMRKNPQLVMNLQMYGPKILFGAILLGYFFHVPVLWWVMKPFVNLFMYVFTGMSA